MIKKSAVISILPAILITLMLDYGSDDKTFVTVQAGNEVVHSGLDGIAMYIEKYGLIKYIVSNIPMFLGLFVTCVILVVIEMKLREQRGVS